MANAPREGRDGGDEEMIWVRSEGEYFSEDNWTGGIRLIWFEKLALGETCGGRGRLEQ
jgi:hypothetical protein